MRNFWFVYRRELLQYIATPLYLVIAGAFLLLTALVFNNDLLFSLNTRPVDVAAIPNLMTLILVVVAPLLTMNLLAGEAHDGTLELYRTSPVTETTLVTAKFLGAWTFFTLLLAITLSYYAIAATFSSPDFGRLISAYMGIWLYGGAALAIGMLFSATTDSVILAAFMSTAALFLLYFGESLGQIINNNLIAGLVYNLTLRGHFVPSFLEGVVRGQDIIYYAGLITLMLYLSIQWLENKRWQRT